MKLGSISQLTRSTSPAALARRTTSPIPRRDARSADASRAPNATEWRRLGPAVKRTRKRIECDRRLVRVASAVLLALSAFAPGARAQFTPSEPEALFVPGDHVPLSEFLVVAPPALSVTLNVRRQVLEYCTNVSEPVQVAVQAVSEDRTTGSFTLHAPTSVNPTNGTVAFTAPNFAARVVVVSDALTNEFPIVTHWDSFANDPDGAGPTRPRGGFDEDATGAISTQEFGCDPLGAHYGEYFRSGGTAVNTNFGWGDYSIGGVFPGIYHWASDRYALFSDGSETNGNAAILDRVVPGYETYIGENWTGAVSELTAIRLSDLSRTWTNRPIAHRKPWSDFHSLEEGLPILQIVHNFIGKYDDEDAANPGREDCLASFVVPPNWTPTPENGYAVLFSAVYDVNDSMFTVFDNGWIRTVGELANENKSAVVIATNGGGAAASLSQQESVYFNHRVVFDAAEDELGIDRTRVVALGASRAATAALALSASPGISPPPFVPYYVLAGVPTTYAGDGLANHVNPTYPLIQEAMRAFTGFKWCWFPGWTDGTHDVGEAAALTMYGVDLADVDLERSNAAPDFLDALADNVTENDTHLVIGTGTHDVAQPFSHFVTYWNELASRVPANRLSVSIHYRVGHGGWNVDGAPSMTDFVRDAIDGDRDSFTAGVLHVHPVDDEAELEFDGTVFSPSPVPMILEAPVSVGVLQPHTYTVVGPPSSSYEIWLDGPSSSVMVASGTLPSGSTVFTTSTHTDEWPDVPASDGAWYLRFKYQNPGGAWHETIQQAAQPPPPVGDATYHATPFVYVIGTGPVIGAGTGGISTDIVEDL